MSVSAVYDDPIYMGECLLVPFKTCTKGLKYTFRDFSKQAPACSKIYDLMLRTAVFVTSFLGAIPTSLLVPLGMGIKGIHSFEKKRTGNVEINPNNVLQPDEESILPKPEIAIVTLFEEGTRLQDGRLLDDLVSIRQIHSYPGDLNQVQRSQLKAKKVDKETLEICFPDTNFRITIDNKDIFQFPADIIVNTVNLSMRGGGGINGLIQEHGGNDYMQYHNAVGMYGVDWQFTEGYAFIVPATGNLKEKKIQNIILTRGPVTRYEDKRGPENDNELYSAYLNTLILAHEHAARFEPNNQNIAIPSISTGSYVFPKDKAAKIALRAIREFIRLYPETSIKNISIRCYEPPLLDIGGTRSSSQEIKKSKDKADAIFKTYEDAINH